MEEQTDASEQAKCREKCLVPGRGRTSGPAKKTGEPILYDFHSPSTFRRHGFPFSFRLDSMPRETRHPLLPSMCGYRTFLEEIIPSFQVI